MKKVALVFVLAVIAPSLVLAWLAMRSLRDQAYVVDWHQTDIYQANADDKAREIANFTKLDLKEAAAQKLKDPAAETNADGAKSLTSELPANSGKAGRAVAPVKDTSPESALSKLSSGETHFRELIADSDDGIFARFL